MVRERTALPPVSRPGTAGVEVSVETPAVIVPLAARRRLFRRRRQMVSLREWTAMVGVGAIGAVLALATLVSFVAH